MEQLKIEGYGLHGKKILVTSQTEHLISFV